MKPTQEQAPKEIKPSVSYSHDDNTGSIINRETGEVLASIMHEGGYWYYKPKAEVIPKTSSIEICDEVLDFINNPKLVRGLSVSDTIRQARQHAQLEDLNRRHDEGSVGLDDYETKRTDIFSN